MLSSASEAVTVDHITQAIAVFLQSLISKDSHMIVILTGTNKL